MGKDPAILFYTGDFLNGCTDLTFEERGQYITLLCLQHQKGHLSEKTIRLSVGSASADVMKKFIQDEEGDFYNERMDEEIIKRQHFLDTRYFNGKKGGRPIEPNNKPNRIPNNKPTENLSENEDENRIEYDSLIENYHSLCPKMNQVKVINDFRKGLINARFSEYGLEKITEVIRKAGESDFLNGKNDKVWKADFEWIMRPQNFVKVMEGKYDNKVKQYEDPIEKGMRELAEIKARQNGN
jgi:uncharacterized protein YdaU (DUF1376 family)